MGATESSRAHTRLIAGAVALLLFGSLAVSCTKPHGISVGYSKNPARGVTTVTVTVTDYTVNQTTVRIDDPGATPIATSSAATFSFDLDTTLLTDGGHQLFVRSETTDGMIANQFPFTVNNA